MQFNLGTLFPWLTWNYSPLYISNLLIWQARDSLLDAFDGLLSADDDVLLATSETTGAGDM